ncbi:MAG: hypothetical protein ACK55Z_05955, partial [bacterium]
PTDGTPHIPWKCGWMTWGGGGEDTTEGGPPPIDSIYPLSLEEFQGMDSANCALSPAPPPPTWCCMLC